MSALAIQLFLRAPGEDTSWKLKQLEEKFGIKARRHPKYGELVHFKYNQIESPMAEQVVRECRGIILNESDNWRVVSRAFDKFFNYGEGHAARIDWATASVQEKVDGSLCVVYPYAGRWHVATTGTPDGGGPVNSSSVTFADYFWDTLERYGDPFSAMRPDNFSACFMFELMGPENRVVVPHEEPHLVVLGGRSVIPVVGKEFTAHDAANYLGRFGRWRQELPAVRSFPLQSFEDIERSFSSMSPLQQEGYVVVDSHFNRVKVKHPGYVALHHAKSGLTEKAFIEICRRGETSEVLAAFPEFRPLMERTKEKIDTYVAQIEADYERLKHIETQKDFAIEAMKTRNPSALFQIRSGKSGSARQYVAEMRLETLRDALA